MLAIQIHAVQRGTITVELKRLRADDRNANGIKCDRSSNIEEKACDKEIQINLGLPNNITRYWNFVSKVYNTFGDIIFFKGEKLTSNGMVENPVSIPFTGLWTVSNK